MSTYLGIDVEPWKGQKIYVESTNLIRRSPSSLPSPGGGQTILFQYYESARGTEYLQILKDT